ncbi:methyltransferase, putative [Trichomonas vaginalis G3]|uniref:Methyltransferase-like protein 5 n=1 Tax=Trichomonas vaginalis (strain ATCC PRA-98 / G3) TaxID=412133 RepID=A2DMU5_TRIV3|nr:DNA repair [Trichomonas vaginalis G3]EAY18316.1 methyltransferase, putative [Trichomonas vaginalis G3]KAI5541862.1 DNA repair [Trichomonas vaginalis G3]|eukprot:XP_001579302.1 methyltransferase [Trichomonas vaginalis G3]
MKLKQLQSLLEGFEGPPEPKIEFEQYPTPARLAAEVIFDASTLRGDIEGKIVADLGCGCGILSIACLVMGAKEVHSFDLDPVSIEAAKRNLDLLEFDEPPPIFFHECDVTKLGDEQKFDTVVMNPPFGTRNKGVDMTFLQVASKISTGAIYSFHKSSTRNHILNIAAPKFGLRGELEMEVNFDLKKLYKFHKKDIKAVEVDIYRFEHIPTQALPKPQ